MRYEPMTEEQAAESAKGGFALFEPGTYRAHVKAAEEQTSKAGDDMIKLTLTVQDAERSTQVFDYVSGAWMAHKLRHLAEHVGALDAYEKGTFNAAHCEGATVWVDLGIEPAKDGYDAKNKVFDYVASKVEGSGAASVKGAAQSSNDGEDLPF